MELPLNHTVRIAHHPPSRRYYSGWTREGVPCEVFGIKPHCTNPATTEIIHDTLSKRDTIVDERIDSLGIKPQDSFTGITNFSNEASYSVSIDGGGSQAFATPVVDEYQDIKRYFERPRLIQSVDAATTRSNLYAYTVQNPILNYWPTNAQLRMNGVYGYRCSIKFTVTLAATPFQQGMVALSWQYGASATSGQLTLANLPRYNNPSAVTNLPHARLDFAEHTMAELSIPYLSPFEFFELQNTTTVGGDSIGVTATRHGIIALTQILPYRTLTAAARPTLRIYVSLHDMELFGAVPVSNTGVLPQSGITSHMNKQSNGSSVAKSSGSVSGFLNKASSLASTVGKAAAAVTCPEAFAAAETVSWLSKAVARTAESLGYSKPVDEDRIVRHWATDTTHEFHVDQPSCDLTISPFQSNRLAVDAQQSASEIDEMAIDFVVGQYGQAFVGNIAQTDTAGTVIYACNVCPTSLWFKTNSGRPGGNTAMVATSPTTANVFQPTSIAYVSQMFKYWRGGIKFRFHFSKTKFHAGRVLAAFIPSTKDNFSSTVLSDLVPAPEIASSLVQPFQYSMVFDLRDASEFEFVVPYVCSRPWLSTFGASGGLTLSVVDQLIVNGEVASTIDFMVEACAASDFELGCFVGSGLAPCVPTNPGNIVQYQSGLNESEVLTQYTMGEKFTSLKQLLMVPTSSYNVYTAGDVTVSLPTFAYAPALNNGSALPLPVNTNARYTTSTQNCITRMYAFYAGGTSYNVYSATPTVYISLQHSTYDLSGPPSLADSREKTPANKVIYSTSGGTSVIHAKVPSYQKAVAIPQEEGRTEANLNLLNTPPKSSFARFALTTPCMTVSVPTGILAKVVVTYAGSDDARCWGYIGPPQCWMINALSSQPIDINNTAYFWDIW